MNKRRIIIFITIISVVLNVCLLYTFKADIKHIIVHKKNYDPIHSNEHINSGYSSYLYCDTISDLVQIHSQQQVEPFLPSKLIITPGVYKVGSNVVDMRKEGLYRFIFPNENNYQVIVYKNNLKAVLSALAWMHTHGDVDNKFSVLQLSEKATHDKVYLTCSKIVAFSCAVLNRLGYRTRIVGGIANEIRNGFDDEHTLLELFDPASNKWIVADIDNNSVFRHKGSSALLDFHELRDALYANQVEQVLLSKDVKFDISGFKSKQDYTLGFIMERRNNSEQLLIWYKRIFKTMIIEDKYFNKGDTENIKKKHPQYIYRDSMSFIRKYYPLLS